jgi:ATP-dependent 26S proteasome regulatory subunit
MANKKKKSMDTKTMLIDPSIPFPLRKQLLVQLVSHESEESNTILESFFEDASSGNGESLFAEKTKELNAMIKELREGPMRFGTFVAFQQSNNALRRAKIRLEDGTTVFPVILENDTASNLERGKNVLLDSQGVAVFADLPFDEGVGEEALLERRIGDHYVEVSFRSDERFVFDASRELIESLERGEVNSGNRLVVCSRRMFAYRALPTNDRTEYYRYLYRGSVPDIVVERDIGAPPAYIDEVVRIVKLEMTNPELRRRYRLRRCMTKLLQGISGSGKSYTLLGLWHKIYEVMSEVIGVSIEELPPRVLKLRSADVLSKYVGESDKNIARFFFEVEQLAGEVFIAPDGQEYTLPVLAVLEEIDGLTRTRGEDAIHDRILTTLLELLDPNRPELKDKLVLFIATTNVSQHIDMAFLRRIGSTVEQFGRLTRSAFIAVLKKHLQEIPFSSSNGYDQDKMLSGVISELTSWLFSPNGEDNGQVELFFIGSSNPETRYRRDFLTAGLVDRAVQRAASVSCDAEEMGAEHPGLTSGCLKAAFDEQIRAIVGQLCAENVSRYLELPEESRVQRVHTIESPTVHPFELMRAS